MTEDDWWLPAIFEAINWISATYDINDVIAKPDSEGRHELGATTFALEQLNNEIVRLKAEGKQVYLLYSPVRNDLNFQDEFSKLILDRLREIDVTFIPLSRILRDDDDSYYDNMRYERGGHRAVADALSWHVELNRLVELK